jgi:hypothetical protein
MTALSVLTFVLQMLVEPLTVISIMIIDPRRPSIPQISFFMMCILGHIYLFWCSFWILITIPITLCVLYIYARNASIKYELTCIALVNIQFMCFHSGYMNIVYWCVWLKQLYSNYTNKKRFMIYALPFHERFVQFLALTFVKVNIILKFEELWLFVKQESSLVNICLCLLLILVPDPLFALFMNKLKAKQ